MMVEWRKGRETMKGYLDNNGNLLGEVFASSGLRVAPSTEDASKLSIRDWALMLPNADHSMGKNDVRRKVVLPFAVISGFASTDAGIDWNRNNTGWQRTRPRH
jgi:hypothetical protein